MTTSKNKMLSKSTLVVAHPDDEVLWFSSILDKVDSIIICFLGCKSKSHLTVGRTKSMAEHPMSNISYLHVDEAEVFSDANFRNPIVTEYGMQVAGRQIFHRKYLENFHRLKKELTSRLTGCGNVFTHNPWGEYGNEEHVQLYRVIRGLKEKLNFNLWFSNYSSNKSFQLMLECMPHASLKYVTLKTNKMLSDRIKKIYEKNGCWSWYGDWEWFDNESFINDARLENGTIKYGHMFPLNMIHVRFSKNSDKKPGWKRRVLRMFSSKRNRSRTAQRVNV